MKTDTINKIRGNLAFSAVLVALSLFGILIPYSLSLGWNLITGFLFWFILVPIVSMLSSRFYKEINRSWIAGIIGCVGFYLVMVFLIYSHYKSDLFILMMVSSISSIFMIWLVEKAFLRKRQI